MLVCEHLRGARKYRCTASPVGLVSQPISIHGSNCVSKIHYRTVLVLLVIWRRDGSSLEVGGLSRGGSEVNGACPWASLGEERVLEDLWV